MAVDLSFSGLASGFDWKSFVNSVMATENAPIDAIKAQQKTHTDQSTALASLQSLITTLQGASTALGSPDLFGGRQVSSATPNSAWTPQAATNTPMGSYTLQVTKLATAASITGAPTRSNTMNATDSVAGLTVATLPIATPVTAGTFTVNGQKITVATTDTLDQVFAAITAATTAAGSPVTAQYDHTTDQVTLTGTGEIILGAANDTSNFLSAFKLANNGTTDPVTSAGTLGVLNPFATIANARLQVPITAVDASGNGTFNINGVTISYNVNNDALGAVITRINQSGAGVTAAYDPSGDRFTLTNNATGDMGINATEATGGLLDALGLTAGTGSALGRGTNAQFTVNGGPTRSSTTNALSAADLGVPGLSVSVNSLDTQTLAVSGNTGAMSTAISNFITAYNDVQSFLDTNTAITNTNGTVTTAVLSSNREVQDWGTTLRAKVFSAVPGLTGSIRQLSDLGIDFTSGTSQLSIVDNTKLTSALTNAPSDVAAYFQTPTTGMFARFAAYTATLLTQDAQQQTTLTKTNSDLDTQIANIQRRLDQQRATLTASFIAMETAQSKIQSQQQALNSAFGTGSSSSSSSNTSATPKLSTG
jgi:flagellar hook-associated protein 2